MDRFIDANISVLTVQNADLKSNMDRFIGVPKPCIFHFKFYLKSNMDRFIGFSFSLLLFSKCKFKIQYG